MQLFAQAVHFTTFGRRWNLALRGQVGLAPNARVQDRYFLGGLDPGTPPTSSMEMPYASGIRGYPDSFVRTESYASFNAEVRFTVFDYMWLALMPAAFVDGAAALRETGTQVVPMLSAGFGIRLLSPRLVRTGVRFDLAVPLVGYAGLAAQPELRRLPVLLSFGFWSRTPRVDQAAARAFVDAVLRAARANLPPLSERGERACAHRAARAQGAGPTPRCSRQREVSRAPGPSPERRGGSAQAAFVAKLRCDDLYLALACALQDVGAPRRSSGGVRAQRPAAGALSRPAPRQHRSRKTK